MDLYIVCKKILLVILPSETQGHTESRTMIAIKVNFERHHLKLPLFLLKERKFMNTFY